MTIIYILLGVAVFFIVLMYFCYRIFSNIANGIGCNVPDCDYWNTSIAISEYPKFTSDLDYNIEIAFPCDQKECPLRRLTGECELYDSCDSFKEPNNS